MSSSIRSGTQAIRGFSLVNKEQSRSYTHVSQSLHKAEQPGSSRAQSQPAGWVVPAALAVVGLGLSTFSTQKMISGSATIKVLPTPATGASK